MQVSLTDSYKVLLLKDITGGNTKPGGIFTENSRDDFRSKKKDEGGVSKI